MKRFLTFFAMCMIALTTFAQMSDEQIVDYVKKQNEAGVSQQQIAQNLIKRGVSRQQLEALRAKYMSQKGDLSDSSSSNADTDDRSRKNNAEEVSFGGGDTDPLALFPDAAKNKIFGHDIFRSKSLSFEPNMNIATPANYVLGPGDEVILDIYGVSQTSSKMKVSPEGSVNIPRLGPVYVAGLTVEQARSKVSGQIGSHYKGSNIKLTVGQTRSILVNVLGEVSTPGTYTLSAFSTVFNALYMAGGITDIGTMRNIKVSRNGHIIAVVDVYDYLVNGRLAGNVMLRDNDAIIVGTYDALVSIDGAIKRPMLYEMKSGESLESLITYAGNFTGDANKSVVRVERKTSEGYSVHSLEEWDRTSFGMQDGDVVLVDTIVKRYKNMVEISGSVFYPGRYSLTNASGSVKGLIKIAGGLTEEAFENRAVLFRMNENRTRKTMSIDLKNILSDNVPDVILQNEDSLVVISDAKAIASKSYYIYGPVMKEGEFHFSQGMTIEDAIIAAGGLKEDAMLSNVEVTRCLNYTDERDSTYITKSKIYTFDIKDGLVVGEDKDFLLMPSDVITIKRDPNFSDVAMVYVGGEVKYPGTYTLRGRTDRLSDLIKRAGGLKQSGFIEGAKFSRALTPEEKERAEQLLELSRTESDSVDVKKVQIKERFYVGIDLDKAMKNPGCSDDIVMRGGDHLIIPSINNTVKINGEVLYPNTVAYQEGKSGSYYINQAGGITTNGKKKDAYIIYANGQVSRLNKGKVQPGCEIVVPTKQKKVDNGQKSSVYLAAASTVATIAAVLVTALK